MGPSKAALRARTSRSTAGDASGHSSESTSSRRRAREGHTVSRAQCSSLVTDLVSKVRVRRFSNIPAPLLRARSRHKTFVKRRRGRGQRGDADVAGARSDEARDAQLFVPRERERAHVRHARAPAKARDTSPTGKKGPARLFSISETRRHVRADQTSKSIFLAMLLNKSQ